MLGIFHHKYEGFSGSVRHSDGGASTVEFDSHLLSQFDSDQPQRCRRISCGWEQQRQPVPIAVRGGPHDVQQERQSSLKCRKNLPLSSLFSLNRAQRFYHSRQQSFLLVEEQWKASRVGEAYH